MKLFYCVSILAFIFCLSPATSVYADVNDGDMIDASVTGPLMAWVQQRTGVRVPVLPTTIASHTRLWNVLRAHKHNNSGRPMSLFAGSTIVLNDRTWDPEDATQVSLLVHEMVHYAQSFMHVRWACEDAKEVQAYNLQNEWLAQHGHQGFVSTAWIQRVSTCPSNSTIDLAQSE